jgi:hypothetical protein
LAEGHRPLLLPEGQGARAAGVAGMRGFVGGERERAEANQFAPVRAVR